MGRGAETDIYNLDGDLAYWRKRIQEDDELAPQTKQDILEFTQHIAAQGRSQPRQIIYLSRLYQLAGWLGKGFREATEPDLKRLLADLSTKRIKNGRNKGQHYSQSTREIYTVALKRAYRFWEGGDKTYPAKVEFIKLTKNRASNLLPEDLLDLEEVRRLMDAANNPRDKALVFLLYESGARIGEIARLQLKHVAFDQLGATLTFPSGKTGARRVRLLYSVDMLRHWLESHPDKANRDAWLWPCLTKNRADPLDYWSFNTLLRKLAKRSGITKRVNPHTFRHSAATRLAKLGLNEAQLEAYLGWTPGTKMTGTYVHLAGRDTDDALLRAYGLKPTEDGKETKLGCTRCTVANALTARYCHGCGMPLTTQAAVGAGEVERNTNKIAEALEILKRLRPLLERPDIVELLEHKEKEGLARAKVSQAGR